MGFGLPNAEEAEMMRALQILEVPRLQLAGQQQALAVVVAGACQAIGQLLAAGPSASIRTL